MDRRYIAWRSGWAFLVAVLGLPLAMCVLLIVQHVWGLLSENLWGVILATLIVYAPFVWLAFRIDRAAISTGHG